MPRTGKPAYHSHNTYKDRYFWFNQRATFPLRDTPPFELEKFWAKQEKGRSGPQQDWQCLGPFNVAGRVTSLVLHPDDSQKWFAGSAAGGVWKSLDAGQSWEPAWSRFTNQNIGALAWAHLEGTLTLIAATGEGNMSADAYPGSGIYYSGDEGAGWRPLIHAVGGLQQNIRRFPRRVGCIATHRDGFVAIGSVSDDDHMPAGLYLLDHSLLNERTNEPVLVPCEHWGRRAYNCHSILFHPHESKTLFATIETQGTHNGIWRSRDGGQSWHHLTRGLPPGDHFRRTTLAFAPSDPDIVYALASDRLNHVLGLFRSPDGGDTWRSILSGESLNETQMSYNNALAVHPRDPDTLVWGGADLHRTDDRGRHWRSISNGTFGKRDYVHPDHHAVLWPEDKVIISGNDGGVALTENGGRTWQDRSRGMVTAMFYDMDVAPSNAKVFGGGTQDNGALIAGAADMPPGDFVRAVPGDGGWMVFDRDEEEHVFTSVSPFLIFRHSPGKPWTFSDKNWKYVRPSKIETLETELRGFTVLAMEQSKRKKVWAGSSRLWRTADDGRHWKVVSPVFDGSAISAIGLAIKDRKLIFAGTMQGGIYRSHDGGDIWSQNLAGIDVPRRAITSIEPHPKDTSTFVITVASTGFSGSGVELRTGENLPYGHVFRSEDAGNTWIDIDRGALPNVVYYASAYETRPPYRLFVGGDVGVFVEQDGTWADFNGNLPNVGVSDLVYHYRSRTLTAATYGRGIWRTPPGPGSARKK